MPLPKPPTRPATLIDLSEAPKAAAARPRARETGTKASASTRTSATTRTKASATNAAPVAALLSASTETPAPAPVSAITARARTTAPGATTRSSTTAASGKAVAAEAPAPPSRSRARRAEAGLRLFVLDTNVLMHDPSCLFRFAEHDVFLPMTVLEELDHHKKGMSEVSRNVRQVSRTLDALIATVEGELDAGIALAALGNREATGKLRFQTQEVASTLPAALPTGKADNQILAVVRAMQAQHPEREVVLVSKDINMRIKARTMGLPAEDYFNDQVIQDTDLLYAGTLQLPEDFWERHGKGVESWQQGGQTYYRISGPLVATLLLNQFVWLDGELPLVAKVREITGKTAVLQTLRDFSHLKNAVWGITARNREQNFALNLLMDPEIDFVTLLGHAGTGKTLLALAAALVQVLENRRYTDIIMTRATVPVGEDIGYLPGTEEEKMQPWMGALEDNLEVLNQTDGGAGDWGRSTTNDLIRSRVKLKAMSFMRGRTFINKFLIVDEAQNLTPKQMKTLVTRAGPGTKVVCLGNIAQIDTPYLTEGSSGLTYVIDRFKGWAHSGHVTLQRGERSRLADFAADAL
ncbi:MAG: PhoH family protein [Burkholderiaceae bacterium]